MTSTGRNGDALVGLAELHEHLRDPRWIVVDARFDLGRPEAGREAYRRGHIPGAVYADLDLDLSGPKRPGLGRHPLPQVPALRSLLSRWGVKADSRVVAYDDVGGAFAARVWWLVRWMGHRNVALLDGGLRAWTAAGLPVTVTEPEPRAGNFQGDSGAMPAMDTGTLVDAVAEGRVRVVDVRNRDRFLGRTEPIDPVAGHIPGAINAPFQDNLDSEGCFRSPGEIRARYATLLDGWPPESVVVMCGSGVTACHGLFTLELAGYPGASLYPGSWSEWIRSPARPVAVG